jgi:hypothetical protein
MLKAEGLVAQPRYGKWVLIGAEEFAAEDTRTVGEESRSQ